MRWQVTRFHCKYVRVCPFPLCKIGIGWYVELLGASSESSTSVMLTMTLKCRRAVLPLVNKRWARVLRGPSHAWRVVSAGCTCCDEEDRGAYYYEEVEERAGQYLEPLSSAAATLNWFTSRPG